MILVEPLAELPAPTSAVDLLGDLAPTLTGSLAIGEKEALIAHL